MKTLSRLSVLCFLPAAVGCATVPRAEHEALKERVRVLEEDYVALKNFSLDPFLKLARDRAEFEKAAADFCAAEPGGTCVPAEE